MLKDDVTRLTLWYLDHGYLQFSAEPPLTLSTEKGMYVFFILEEGEQFTVKSMQWENATEEEQFILASLQTLLPGQIFSRQRLTDDITAMTDYYADQGHAFAEIIPMYFPDEASLTVDVIYRVQKGEKYYIGDIRIAGNTKTRDKVIRRDMAMIEGDLYSSSMLRVLQERGRTAWLFRCREYQYRTRVRPEPAGRGRIGERGADRNA